MTCKPSTTYLLFYQTELFFPLLSESLCCLCSESTVLTRGKLIVVLWAFLSYIGKTDSITISIWNHKKIHKRQGAGFLGCIRLLSNAISRLKDTGCKSDSAVRLRTFFPKIRALLTFSDLHLSSVLRPAS